MTNNNSVYKLPDAVIKMVLEKRGLPTHNYGLNAKTQTKIGKLVKILERQWRQLMLTTDFGILNDLLSVRYQANGQLKITHRDNRKDGDLNLVMPHRFVDAEFVNAHLQKVLGWVEVAEGPVGFGRGLVMKTIDGTSGLRAKALIAANDAAREELDGTAIQGNTGSNPRLGAESVYIDDRREDGVPLHRVYWLLYTAKSTSQNLAAMMRLALRGNMKTVIEVKRHDTSESFEKFLEARSKMRPHYGAASIENLPIPEIGSTTNGRTWGIEVEAAGARGVDSPGDGWDRRGDGSLRSAYSGGNRSSEDCPDHDHNEELYRDGEWIENPDYEDPDYCDWLEYDDGDDDYGDCAEFVSPILYEGGNQELRTLLSELIDEPQNDSAGIHIHVGAKDLSPKQIGGLVFAYQMIEPIITEAYRREERGYCRVRRPDSVISTMRSTNKPGARKTRSENGSGDVIDYGDRYLSLNLCALEAHGTVEFRAMGPVYEYDHLIKWALFCREMVNMAKADTPPKVWTSIKSWAQLEAAMVRYGSELKGIRVAELEEQIKVDELVTA